MAIDLTKPELFKKLTLDDLMLDAVERNDEKALRWLQDQSNKMSTRKKEDGTEYKVRQSVVQYRTTYLKEFCGYKPAPAPSKEKAKLAKKDKVQRELDRKFAEAFKMLKK